MFIGHTACNINYFQKLGHAERLLLFDIKNKTLCKMDAILKKIEVYVSTLFQKKFCKISRRLTEAEASQFLFFFLGQKEQFDYLISS